MKNRKTAKSRIVWRFLFLVSGLIIFLAAAGFIWLEGQLGRLIPNDLIVRFPTGVQVVEVPFRVEANKILLDIAVNGSEPLVFVLDTGSPLAAMLRPEKLAGVEIEYQGETRVAGIKNSGESMIARIAQHVHFDIGGLQVDEAAMLVLPADGMKHLGEIKCDGIIGNNFLSSLVVEIEWENRIMRFHEPDSYQKSPMAIVVSTEIRKGKLFVPGQVTIGGEARSIELAVDTGAFDALALRPDRVGLPARRLEDVVIGRGLNGVIRGDVGRIDQLRFAQATFEDVVARFPNRDGRAVTSGADGCIGNELLRRFNVIFDHPHRRMYIEHTEATANPFLFSTCGVRLQNWIGADGTIGLEDVYPASPAERAGITIEDRIVAVNAQPVAELGIDAIRDLLRQSPGTRVLLQVRHADSVREVELELDTVL